jgi:hypothetical protein
MIDFIVQHKHTIAAVCIFVGSFAYMLHLAINAPYGDEDGES